MVAAAQDAELRDMVHRTNWARADESFRPGWATVNERQYVRIGATWYKVFRPVHGGDLLDQGA